MDRNYILLGVLTVQIIVFVLLILSNKWNNKSVHYSILLLITGITITHIFSYNTDSEDIYISLRYVKNFVEGNGLVFNTYEKVEGYSDFLWVVLIAGIHKILRTDIPQTARYLSLATSVITLLYSYYLLFKLTQNKLISYLTTFLISISGSFACYGLAGLENPLFALFILLIINYTYEQKWVFAGFYIGLIIMTRPEGFIIYFPVVIYIYLQESSLQSRIKNCILIALVAAVLVIPWTIWRVSYYGYFLPNSIAAKQGMDLFFQIKSGLTYSAYFLIIISESILILWILPFVYFFYTRQKISTIFSDKQLILLVSTAFIFIAFYSFAGGDWMPCWRFYASLIPLFSIIIAVVWNKYVFKNQPLSLLNSVWIVCLFALSGYIQIRNSFMNTNMIHLVKIWSHQVNGLKEIGKWFHYTLPENTLIATFPNGAFSYYNELPTIDMGGITDAHVARKCIKVKEGLPGHTTIATEYILYKKPLIIAFMEGVGFENEYTYCRKYPGYVLATFDFLNYSSRLGEYVSINIRQDKKDEIINYLLKDKNVKLVHISTP